MVSMIALRAGQAMFDKTKGSTTNRIAYAKDQIKNDYVTAGKVGLGVGTSFGTAYLLKKAEMSGTNPTGIIYKKAGEVKEAAAKFVSEVKGSEAVSKAKETASTVAKKVKGSKAHKTIQEMAAHFNGKAKKIKAQLEPLATKVLKPKSTLAKIADKFKVIATTVGGFAKKAMTKLHLNGILSKVATKMKPVTNSVKNFITKVAPKVKNFKFGKFGKAALVTLPLIYAANALFSGIYKSGQIDQKYTDSAKLESTMKNVVLEEG